MAEAIESNILDTALLTCVPELANALVKLSRPASAIAFSALLKL